MIRVTVELLPQGNADRKLTLATMELANDGTGDDALGNYRVKLDAEYTGDTPRTGLVLSYARQSASVWTLVGAALKMFGHTKHPERLLEKEPWDLKQAREQRRGREKVDLP